MSKYKCIECGQEFAGNYTACPNCGCPSSACQVIEEEKRNDVPNQQKTTYGGQPQPGATPYQQGSQQVNYQTQPGYRQMPYYGYSQKPKRQCGTFEIVCYVFAGIFAFLFIFQQTTRSGVVNLDGSNMALRWEIGAFSWLIVGRLTALVNK